MKKNTIKLILIAFFLLAGTTTPALADGGGLPPLCYPKACPVNAGTATPLSFSGPGLPPLCYPGEPACPIK
jgi:hypothetical protein